MARTQYGALPYRFDKAGDLEILLVTSRRSRRWIIPKGWPIAGLAAAETAAREAFEEAGAVGDVETSPLGSYQYEKLLKGGERSATCEVTVFPLRVQTMLDTWPEASQRTLRWMSGDNAIALASGEGLKSLIGRALPALAALR